MNNSDFGDDMTFGEIKEIVNETYDRLHINDHMDDWYFNDPEYLAELRAGC